ncbi:L-threonylcarbamoyladenylate synthase [Alkalilimnicola sp. S0819]|uniref:L-threonylcarbamoyladenylate synthase n=1 Tax=Alkalilimnicola sp. S0819 TaxID=2613922 RepID=UPI001261C9AA|nr:Sua5/YciO/YrdC/YwlC family protein [Alkalilimnicola sp. S0819]KAB7627237.1 tRNA threonylcarbamoyladenosine biosynthesis protein RimN [Alkalilimnicola sp. S0819]MPQ15950.1 tRNA threonylcarbamoyladenosine biosynthesis protein RimN [Alkalilimnicola sp. S0819]
MTAVYRLAPLVRRLRGGGVIAYPTEAVYGLGCDPANPAAVAGLLALKGRQAAKGLILIAADLDQLRPWLAPLSPHQEQQLAEHWPGPITWLVPKAADVPAWLSGHHDTLAVRVTAHEPAAALCRAFGGALVSTSANRSGQAPARSALRARSIFGGQLAGVLNAPLGGLRRPTEIRDLQSGRVIRAGDPGESSA